MLKTTFKTVFWLLLFIVLVDCGERNRVNPFDPAGSRVENVLEMSLITENRRITIRWQPWHGPDIEGYNIYRGVVPGELKILAKIPFDVTSYQDTNNIKIGEQYVYGISARSEDDETYITTLDTITTGNSRWWVLSEDFSPLSQLSHDGLHRNNSYGRYIAPRFVTAPNNSASIFVYDRASDSVFRQSDDGRVNLIADQIQAVREFYYNRTYDDIFIARGSGPIDEGDYIRIQKLPSKQYYDYKFNYEVTDIKFSGVGTTWLSSRDSLFVIPEFGQTPEVYYTDAEDRVFTHIELYHRRDLLKIFLSTDDGTVIMIDGEGNTTELSVAGTPVVMKYNASDESLWILGVDNQDTYSVYRYDGISVEKMLGDLVRVYDIAVNPISNECLVPDYSTEIVYTIDPEGDIRSKKNVAGRIYQVVAQSVVNSG